MAWSNLGCFAYVSQDGLRVNIRYLRCHPSDGKWELSEESPLFPIAEVHRGIPLIHILFNETGSELAVVDSSGRLSIYTVTTALNQITVQRPATFDPEGVSNQVVGIMWLNSNRFVSTSPPSLASWLTSIFYFTGLCISSSRQDEWALGISAFSASARWAFSPRGQAGLGLCDEIGCHSTGISKSRQQVV